MDDPSPLLRRLEELELERRPAAERVLRAEAEQDRVRILETVTERDVAQLLAGLAEDIAALDRETLKDVLRAWIGKIELDPTTRAGRLIYRLTLNPVSVASPRGAD